MKTGNIVLLSIIGFFVVMGMWLMGSNNNLVNLDESVQQSWGQVENVYQRRSDLIPNLVETVKGYATHEKGTLQAVIEARASATQMKIDISKATPEDLAKYQQAQGMLGQAMSRLMVASENYPELKANANFMDLQKQIEGTENRITVERMAFNEVTQKYNYAVRAFPSNIVASMKGMQSKPYFKAEENAKAAPKVTF